MKTLIIANWKMNGSMDWVEKPAQFQSHLQVSNAKAHYIICPPFHLIGPLVAASQNTVMEIGARNCHFQASGAYTGEISAGMLAEIGAAYVILGHSERRTLFGEKSKTVAKKVVSADNAGLVPIVCIGESLKTRDAGQADEFVGKQLRKSLSDGADPANLVIAYEPIWAIGTGLTPTLEDIAAMHDHIRGVLATIFTDAAAQAIPILYGGSVNPGNAKEILALGDVNGALVGGASLDMQSFAAIANAI